MKVDNRFDKTELSHLLNAAYGLNIEALTFFPEGEDSYGYIALSQGQRKYFVKAYPTFPRKTALDAALQVSVDLYEKCGVANVVPPLRARNGELMLPWRDFWVVVFDFIEGESQWEFWKRGEDFTDENLRRVAEAIAALHRSAHQIDRQRFPVESFDFAREANLLAVLDNPGGGIDRPNAYQQRVIEAVSTHRLEILNTLKAFKRLQASARAMNRPPVMTHGDPSAGNVILGEDGNLYLVDWDGVASGPPERDLTTFTGERFQLALPTPPLTPPW